MTTVSGAGGAAPAQTVQNVSVADLPLNEAAIILMLKHRTSDLDAQVSGVMRAIEQQTNNSEEIQKKIEVLQAIDQAIQAGNGDGDSRLENLIVNFDGESYRALELLKKYEIDNLDFKGGGYQEAQRKQEDHRDALEVLEDPLATPADKRRAKRQRDSTARWLENHMGMDDPLGEIPVDDQMKVKSSAVQAAIAQLETQSRQANSANELQMIRMQTAMQQRSQVITMATQMIKSISDSNDAIARNM